MTMLFLQVFTMSLILFQVTWQTNGLQALQIGRGMD